MNDEQLNTLNKWQLELGEIKKELEAKAETFEISKQIDKVAYDIRDFISDAIVSKATNR